MLGLNLHIGECSIIRKMLSMNLGIHSGIEDPTSRLAKWWFFFENLVVSPSRDQHIKVIQLVGFRDLQILCDTRAQHYGLTCKMNFLVLGLLLKHMNLWLHLLNMAIKYCNLNLTWTLVVKMLEVFCHLKLRQFTWWYELCSTFHFFWNLCVSTDCYAMNFKKVCHLFQLCCSISMWTN